MKLNRNKMIKYVSVAAFALMVNFTAKAQQMPPNGFNYQAVARNASGAVMANQQFDVRISVISDTTSGFSQYTEVHADVKTNQFGLFNIVIGKGQYVGGLQPDLYSVPWDASNQFIRVEMDLGNGVFTPIGIMQLYSVPYAFYAGKVKDNNPGLTGPTGPQGPSGLNGLNGAQGPQGIQGPMGPQGIQGLTGPQGPQGVAGANGAVGPQGPQGEVGPQGIAGANGAVGPQGPQGEVGPQGLAGIDGAVGPMGPQGEVGPQGPAGIDGLDGAVGPMGPQGEMGPQGPQGIAGLDGAVGPMGPQGEVGPQGEQGAEGPMGPQGDVGPQGEQGAEGPQGPQGFLQNGASAGNTPYWNGSEWITDNSNIFNNGGNIGIGTDEPVSRLHVNAGNNVPTISIGDDINLWDVGIGGVLGIYGQGDESRASIKLGNTDALISGANNYIGIGTADPNATLQVVGNFTAGHPANLASGSNAIALGFETQATGDYSSALGVRSVASGWTSTAWGYENTASNHYSTAFGHTSTASGTSSTAFGNSAVASGNTSIAMGLSANASGDYSIAGGQAAQAGGLNAIAFGHEARANGDNSVALGRYSYTAQPMSFAVGEAAFSFGYGAIAIGAGTSANGSNAVAIGNSSYAIGDFSTGIGYGVLADAPRSTALGAGTSARSIYEFAIGSFNSDYTPNNANGWDANDRLFVVGNGQSNGAKSNALTMLKNGNLGLGIETPTATLDVAGTVKIADGSQGAGKVLTSDNDGNATWQTLASGGSSSMFSNPVFATISSATVNLDDIGTSNKFYVLELAPNMGYYGDVTINLPSNPVIGEVYTIAYNFDNGSQAYTRIWDASNNIQLTELYVEGTDQYQWITFDQGMQQFVPIMKGGQLIWFKITPKAGGPY